PAAVAAHGDELLGLGGHDRRLVRHRDRPPALHRVRARAHVRGGVGHRVALHRVHAHDVRAAVHRADHPVRHGREGPRREAAARARLSCGEAGPRSRSMSWNDALPLIFMALMGLAMLVYVVLDGYDLGVGLLLPRATDAQKDVMIASIGPFWDANETWLVLGVGILLIAFPRAHGVVLGALYLPAALMLIGLILRGVAFDFRVKARDDHKPLWNRVFFIGSAVASIAQGWMLGRYITGFAEGAQYTLFAAAIALALPATYVLHGATWLVMKTEGDLQQHAVRWAKIA